MSRPEPSTSRRGSGAWPVVAALALVYFVALTATLLSVTFGSTVPWGQRMATVLFFFFLLVLEAAAIIVVEGLVHRLWKERGSSRWRDGLTALVLAGGLSLLLASLLKFRATTAHLKVTDVWFLVHNVRQLFEESLWGELFGALTALGIFVLLSWASYRSLGRLRESPARLPVGPGLVLVALAAGGLAYTWAVHPAVPIFARQLVPETHWLSRVFEGPAPGGSGKDSAEGGRPIVAYAPPAPSNPWNVVLVMLESVPWGRTGLTGAPAEATPNLLRLAEESVVFTRAYTTSTHSDYAQMAVLSSLHPRKFNQHDYYQDLSYPRTLLWDALAPVGYATSVFSCQNEGWGNMLAYLSTAGLGTLRHSPDWPEAPHKGRGSESKVFEPTVVEAWKGWREEAGEPYFTYLNLQASHFPYEIPEEAEKPFAPHELDFTASFLGYPREKVPVMLNRFHNALRFSDRYLGEVIDEIKARGEWERTVLVVVSDHGEAFYEHAEPTHGTSLYEEQVRSLLLVRIPGMAPRRVEEPVSLLDIAPMLLEELGLPRHGNFQGRSDVLDPAYSAENRPLFFTIQGLTFEDGVILDGWKYVVSWDRRYQRLFSLEEDPGETVNRMSEEPARAAHLRQVLEAFLNQQLGYYTTQGWKAGRYPPALP